MAVNRKIILVLVALNATLNTYAQLQITCLSSIRNTSTNQYTTRVHWLKDTNVCGGSITYEIYNSSTENGTGSVIATVLGKDSSVTLSPTATPPKYVYIKSIKPSCSVKNSFSKIILIKNGLGLGPSKPILDLVSVDSLGKAYVSWIENPLTPVDKYFIYRFDTLDGARSLLDSIKETTLYFNPNSKAHSQIEGYDIAVRDGCQNLSDFSERFKTIHLKASYNKCKQEVSLNWNAYNHFQFGTQNYEVHLIQNNVDSIIAITDSLEYIHDSLSFGEKNIYYIKANALAFSKSSKSNRDTIQVEQTRPLDNLALMSVTIENKQPVLSILLDDSTYYNYKVYRGTNDSNLIAIDSLPLPDSTFVKYTDTLAKVNSPFYYQIIAFDSCGIALDSSKIHKTIYLNIKSASFLNDLNWNNYQIGDSIFANFTKTYRLKDFEWESTPFYTSTDSISSFTDDLRLYYESNNEFCYYIQSFVLNDTVKSNVSCDKQQTLIFVPSGFKANNVTQFKPKGSFISDLNYKLQVYNRWGFLIFESTDKKVGWTGEDFPTGTYVFYIEYQIHTGENLSKKGVVSLIR